MRKYTYCGVTTAAVVPHSCVYIFNVVDVWCTKTIFYGENTRKCSWLLLNCDCCYCEEKKSCPDILLIISSYIYILQCVYFYCTQPIIIMLCCCCCIFPLYIDTCPHTHDTIRYCIQNTYISLHRTYVRDPQYKYRYSLQILHNIRHKMGNAFSTVY